MKLQADVVPGVHRIEDSFTNWCLFDQDGRLTVVDTGVPASWQSLLPASARLGRKATDVEAVVLTHAHFDQLGFAERARSTPGGPGLCPRERCAADQHPWRYDHERARAYYFATQFRPLPMVASFVRHRAWWPAPVKEFVRYTDGTLPVPGEPQVLSRPGTRRATARCCSPGATR